MNNHQTLYLNTVQEYNRQIMQLLGMGAQADRKELERLSGIMKKLKSSLQKLNSETDKFKRYVNNPSKYKAALKPYIEFLETTKAEIEKVGKQHEPEY